MFAAKTLNIENHTSSCSSSTQSLITSSSSKSSVFTNDTYTSDKYLNLEHLKLQQNKEIQEYQNLEKLVTNTTYNNQDLINISFDSLDLKSLNIENNENETIKEEPLNIIDEQVNFVEPENLTIMGKVKSVIKKKSIKLFRREQASFIVDPPKSILKSKVNKNFEVEKLNSELQDIIKFEEFLKKFEYMEIEKMNSLRNTRNDENFLNTARNEQIKNYYCNQ
ncbi:unnamed protein product [Candida verbasci]|uniref:Uncharacterized protein n=1 Tax=Candida verbasci TaxID=1227364 RepID=A0A9W4TXS3_9ASCO|nr:unnamed protein product [Candida verbasci]